MKNLIGMKFGRFLVKGPDLTKHGRKYWKCRCDCGRELYVLQQNLLAGKSRSCGCLKAEIVSKRMFSDITNEKFGRLTALECVGKDSRGRYLWRCDCDCGESVIVDGCSLRSGNTRSCGCLNIEQITSLGKSSFVDLSNQWFGRLLVVSPTPARYLGSVVWLCVCHCDDNTKTECFVTARHLVSGHTRSCGCLHTDVCRNRLLKYNTEERCIVSHLYSMRDRCNNPHSKSYKYYGGKGIKICDAWSDPINFINWAKNSGFRKDLTIERLNNDLGYSPDNCTWIPMCEQAAHRSSCRMISLGEQTKTISDWAKLLSIHPNVFYKKSDEEVRCMIESMCA